MTGKDGRYIPSEDQSPGAAAADTVKTPVLRKACDFCCERKRRCDGQRPCSFCTARSRNCHYSVRKPSRGSKTKTAWGSDVGAAFVGSTSTHLSGGLSNLRLKRMKLSVSPATGLVGLKENGFLGTFFGCLNFLPLACESTVRQGLIKTMLGVRRGRNGGAPAESASDKVAEATDTPMTACRNRDQEETSAESRSVGGTECSTGDARPNVDNIDQGSVRNAAVCEMWCAIAIGALVQGQPPERVASYRHLAWIALSGCFDEITPETARAYAIMAYLHNFMGDEKMFYRYLKMAKGMVDVLPPEQAQAAQDIEHVLMRLADARISHSVTLPHQELLKRCEDFCADEVPGLKIPRVLRKETLCNLLIQADVKMYQLVLQGWKRSAEVEEVLHQAMDEGSDSLDDTVAVVERSCPDVEREESGYRLKVGASMDDDSEGDKGPCQPPPQAPSVDPTIGECLELFKRMSSTNNISEVNSGAGGLLIKAFQSFMELRFGEKRAGAQKLVECANIMVEFPGLLRFSRWHHISHCVLGFLAVVGNSELYERLRQIYNRVLIGKRSEVPPREEWKISTVCDHLFCRVSDERLQKIKRSAVSSTQQTQDKSVIASSGKEGSGLTQVEQCQKEKQNILPCQEHVETGELQDTSKVFPQEMLSGEVCPEERHVSSTALECGAQHHVTGCFAEATNQVALGLEVETPQENRQLDPVYPETFVHYASAEESHSCTPDAERDMGLDLQAGMLLRDSGAPPLRLVSADRTGSDKCCKEKRWGESGVGMLQLHRSQSQEASRVAPQAVPLRYPGMSFDLRLLDPYDIGEYEGNGQR